MDHRRRPYLGGRRAITASESDAILSRDLAIFEKAVRDAVKVPLRQNEFDALVSLAFNIGAGAFTKSTLVKKLNAGVRAGAGADRQRRAGVMKIAAPGPRQAGRSTPVPLMLTGMRALLTALCWTALAAQAAAAPLAACTEAKRVTCVVDGDTVWIEGEKIRLAGIDAPEVKGECEAEQFGAARSTLRLGELLGGGPYRIERSGHDRYGRTLATIRVRGSDVGERMVAEGFARPWPGHRGGWCGFR